MAVINNSQYKKKAVGQIVGRLVGGEIIGLCFSLFYVVAKRSLGALANVIFGLCTLGCLLCLFADYCLKLGGKMKGNVTLHKEKPEQSFGIVLGLISTIPYYISYVVLIISKLGIVGSFTGYFKLINACFFPIIDIFAKSSVAATDISWAAIVVIGLLPALMVAACHISYRISYDNIDVASKVLYKSKD